MTQIKLRNWQIECAESALAVYERHSHFLCHATPGAGKTVMVASVAKTLFLENKIDFVICFSPSRAVARGVAETFSRVLGRSFNGQMGAAGGSYTYQSMDTLPDELWRVLDEYRVFVVLDEIHHCSGTNWSDSSIGNSWGRTILERIQGKASYTMSLSGTPWRTDNCPIALSHYRDSDGQISCDYEYGLRRAISDQTCRAPQIVLVDNREISLQSSAFGCRSFASISESLENKHIKYPDFLFRDEIIDQILSEASRRLTNLRRSAPEAGGLVVASSVAHAEQIARRLSMIDETSIIVTYKSPDAQKTISKFKTSSARWIVSVGMISEGTDIPRLHVCCHLSRIRTELHFRQVLGRILRRQETEMADSNAWLYVLAEPSLTEFARRIEEDLPGERVVSIHSDSVSTDGQTSKKIELVEGQDLSLPLDPVGRNSVEESIHNEGSSEKNSIDLHVSNRFWNEILSLFVT
ncbi:DEAD/DEAH box helicase family protein [Marinobacter sp. NFXS11]|uniref:DEAD/DEAH box helicase n=1 Tax=Marinobacter sp. NFXS11 TaxID=2818432 RepID=UPI000C8FB286|nr:helicase [Rhodopirellula sp.]